MGIVYSTWPSWIHAFSSSSFTITWLLTDNQQLHEWIQRIYPLLSSHLLTSTSALPAVDLLAFNGKQSGLSSPPLCACACFFDWNFRKRPAWSSWQRHHVHFPHTAVGGVTDHSGHYSALFSPAYQPSLHRTNLWIPAPPAPLQQFLCPNAEAKLLHMHHHLQQHLHSKKLFIWEKTLFPPLAYTHFYPKL